MKPKKKKVIKTPKGTREEYYDPKTGHYSALVKDKAGEYYTALWANLKNGRYVADVEIRQESVQVIQSK